MNFVDEITKQMANDVYNAIFKFKDYNDFRKIYLR